MVALALAPSLSGFSLFPFCPFWGFTRDRSGVFIWGLSPHKHLPRCSCIYMATKGAPWSTLALFVLAGTDANLFALWLLRLLLLFPPPPPPPPPLPAAASTATSDGVS